MEGTATFEISATWDLARKEGRTATPDGALATTHVAAPALGGTAGPNPETLLLAALASCFAQTWAIFLEKLRIPIPLARVDATATLDKDPAGGYRLTGIAVTPRVPADLLESRRADVEKTVALAEKYCIISKVVRSGIPLAACAAPPAASP